MTLRSLLPVSLLVTLLAPVRTAHAAAQGAAPSALRGASVTPRVVRFDDLPRRPRSEHLPVRERPEARFPQADSVMEALKQHPRRLGPETLGTLTLDANLSGGGPLAPISGTGFEGISQGGYIPSEPTVAAGPINIFTAGNVSVTVTNKDGTNRVETDGQAFFGVPAAELAISDAQCYYDALRGRFVALCFTQGTSPNFSNFYLAISQTNDARGAWYLYKFDMTKDGSTSTNNWGDYQALGMSDDKLAFSSQQFSFSGNLYQYQKIRIIDRALAYTGAPVSYVDFVNFTVPSADVSDLFVTKVGRNLTAGDNTIHCLCVRTNGGSNVTYRTVTGPPASPSLSAGNIVPVSAYTVPPDAAQLGSGTLVVTNDCRPSDFYIRNGVLICAWHTGATISSTTVSAIRLLRMRTSDRAVLTDETYGQASTFYFYPAATVDSAGTIFLGFGRSSSTEHPSAYATGKRRGDAAIQPSVLLKAGLSATAQSRWGDYTGIDNDASATGPGGAVAWYAGQWTKASNIFGTWINRLSYTYGQIAGTVLDDCDGNAGTTGDRAPRAGVSLTLMQGATTLATTLSDGSGQYNFGYLESGTYDVIVTAPGGGAAVDAVPGAGGTSQTRISAVDLQVNLTNAQTSTANQFLVAGSHPAPAAATLTPTSVPAGSGGFTLTISGSNFATCSVARLDGSDRPTTYVSAVQVTAAIPGTDVAAVGTRTITVFTPAPGGGTSGGLTFTVTAPDLVPPTATLDSPVGGESWAIGSGHAITWTAGDDIGVSAVDLDYSTDGGATFPNAIAHGLANSGSYAWTVPGTPSPTARVRVIAVDAGHNLASDSSHTDFTIAGWTITASAGANGAIAPNGAVGVPDGATPAFTLTPAVGYSVADVLVDGGSVGAVTGYTFGPVHADHTIAASFAINSYTLNVTSVGSGSVANSPDQPSYTHGTPVTLTATPSPGWLFQGWSGDASGTTNPLPLSMTASLNITATFWQHIYVWNQTGSAAWGTAANWTPARTTPATDDVLIFSGGGSVTATGVPAQTIAQLKLSGGSTVALQPVADLTTLTIQGGAGVDLDVPAGCTLSLNSASALTIALGASATGTVGGTVAVSNAAHRLNALGTNALEFLTGSLVNMGTGITGNVFGTGSGTSALNSVVFRSGSLCAQSSGGNPFGASQPSSVVTFEHGSRFRIDGSITPAFSGRTYADFEDNTTFTMSPTGGSPCTLDSVIVTKGTLNIGMTGGCTIRGSMNVKAGATLNFNPASGTPTYTLAGTAPQTIDIQGSFSTSTNTSLAVNNMSGVLLATSVTLAGPLSFTSGKITTGANTLAIASSGTVIGAGQGTGYVAGKLRRNFSSSALSRTFDIGDAAAYTPVTVVMANASPAFDVTASTTTPDHANLASSDLDPSKSVNRTWTLLGALPPGGVNYAATFGFASSDVDLGADPLAFQVRRYNAGWNPVAIGARTATSTQGTGVTGFGDFAIAQLLQYALNVTIVGSGGVVRAPDLPAYTPGVGVTLTASPTAGWAFAGWSGDGTGATNPLNVTMNANMNITATFADTTPPSVSVVTPNGGEILQVGSNATLTWSASDNVAVTAVDLLLSRTGSGGPFAAIVSGVANTGSYDWTVTGPSTGNAVLEAVAHDGAGSSAADTSNGAFTVSDPLAVEGASATEFALSAAWPNPMQGSGRIGFALPHAASLRLTLLDLQGREVRVLAQGEFGPGRHDVTVASARGGATLEPGLYFARLRVEGRTFVRRIAITR